MKKRRTTKSSNGARTQGHFIPMSRREQRVLVALMQGPQKREDIDVLAPASNGPGVIHCLRHVHGFDYRTELCTELKRFVTYDGLPSRFGIYSLSPEGKARARQKLEQQVQYENRRRGGNDE